VQATTLGAVDLSLLRASEVTDTPSILSVHPWVTVAIQGSTASLTGVQIWFIQYCLLTPELQWQSRGKRRTDRGVNFGGGSTGQAVPHASQAHDAGAHPDIKLTFLSLKLTFLSLKLTFLT
jgi:hypothetical protein